MTLTVSPLETDQLDEVVTDPFTTGPIDTRREIFAAFLADEVGAEELPEPAWGPIGQEVFDRTYSRPIYKRDPATGEPVVDALGTRVLEDWWTWSRPTHDRTNEHFGEMCRRVVQGNLAYAPEHTARPDEALEMFTLMYGMGGTPAGRHLWVTGTGLSYSRNCWAAGWAPTTSEHFRFGAMRLFEGGGVGSNYSNDLLDLTEPVYGPVDVLFTCRADHADIADVRAAAGDRFVSGEAEARLRLAEDEQLVVDTVDDSREGWVATWCDMVDLACTPGRPSTTVLVDVSGVRPYGAPLLTFGGQASGPGPLVTACLGISEVLTASAAGGDGVPTRLTSLEAMQIDHLCASAVVAGGTRRSARMSLKYWGDEDILDFVACKKDPSQHWTTNISVEIDSEFAAACREEDHPRHGHATAVLRAVAEGMTRDGEPGLVDTERHSVGEPVPVRIVNPCGEASLTFDVAGQGFGSLAGESCNLGSINLDAFGTDIDGAVNAIELVSRFLLRATMKPYPGEDASRIEARNRRIGAGIMGLHGWVMAHGVRLSELARTPHLLDRLTRLRQASRRAADELADAMGVPRPVKTTAIAPTGSISQTSGTTPATNPVMFKHFIRNVRFEANNPRLPELAAQGYKIEKDEWATNTMVVSFPVRDGALDRFDADLVEDSTDLGFGDYLDLVAAVEESFCGGTDGMAVSSTCQLPVGVDPAGVYDQLLGVLGRTKGVTAFPAQSRPQAPYIGLTESEFYSAVLELSPEAQAKVTGGDSNDGSCSTGACPVR